MNVRQRFRWFPCLFPWSHDFGWPQKGKQVCVDCGKERPASIVFSDGQAKFTPRLVDAPDKPKEKTVTIRKRRGAQ